jgi:hypothetical protein
MRQKSNDPCALSVTDCGEGPILWNRRYNFLKPFFTKATGKGVGSRMGYLKRQGKQKAPDTYYDPETVSILDAKGDSGHLVRNTYLDRIEIRAQTVKAYEAALSYSGMQQQAATEFLALANELRAIEQTTDDPRNRSLLRQYSDQALHQTANSFDRFMQIAFENQAAIVNRSVNRKL